MQCLPGTRIGASRQSSHLCSVCFSRALLTSTLHTTIVRLLELISSCRTQVGTYVSSHASYSDMSPWPATFSHTRATTHRKKRSCDGACVACSRVACASAIIRSSGTLCHSRLSACAVSSPRGVLSCATTWLHYAVESAAVCYLAAALSNKMK